MLFLMDKDHLTHTLIILCRKAGSVFLNSLPFFTTHSALAEVCNNILFNICLVSAVSQYDIQEQVHRTKDYTEDAHVFFSVYATSSQAFFRIHFCQIGGTTKGRSGCLLVYLT